MENTNGATEGFNNKIKALKQVSYGVKIFKRYQNHILLTTTKGWN
ncbi:MAG: transposase [Bacillota bacterium]